jgi:hypothetical protein
MKKRTLTLTQELNEIKRVMKQLLNENENNIPINQRKDIIDVDPRYWNIYHEVTPKERDKSDGDDNGGNFYGEADSFEFTGEYSSPYGDLFGVSVKTKKDGVDYMELELGFDIEITYYQPASRSRDYYQPDDPGEVDFNIILVQGTSSLISDENGEKNKLSEEELEIINGDRKIMDYVRDMEDVNELAWGEADAGKEPDYDDF